MAIALTIIPWLHEWLVFYEGWLLTGEWQGGGIHPVAGDTKAAARNREES